jgi:hypothetical protein
MSPFARLATFTIGAAHSERGCARCSPPRGAIERDPPSIGVALARRWQTRVATLNKPTSRRDAARDTRMDASAEAATILDGQDIRVILCTVLHHLSQGDVAKQVTQDVYDRTLELSRALGVRIARPRAPRIAAEVASVVQYAQSGIAKLSNEEVPETINSVIETLTRCCYPPATAAARAIFDRKAGEAQSDIELVLLAARARWRIELGWDVPIRSLAASR